MKNQYIFLLQCPLMTNWRAFCLESYERLQWITLDKILSCTRNEPDTSYRVDIFQLLGHSRRIVDSNYCCKQYSWHLLHIYWTECHERWRCVCIWCQVQAQVLAKRSFQPLRTCTHARIYTKNSQRFPLWLQRMARIIIYGHVFPFVWLWENIYFKHEYVWSLFWHIFRLFVYDSCLL